MKKEDKAKYIEKRNSFRLFRSALQKRLEEFPDEKERAANLISKMRPRTPNGEHICLPCDVISMVPVEKKYWHHHDFDYSHECELCYGNKLGSYSQ